MGWARKRRDAETQENVLKVLFQRRHDQEVCEEAAVAVTTGVDERVLVSVLAELERLGQVTREGSEWLLTEAGRARGAQILRAHRLLETYLFQQQNRRTPAIHREAERREHEVDSATTLNALADRLGNPRYDPDGDPIPDRWGRLPPRTGRLLPEWPDGEAGRVVHLEDEPADRYQALIALGLAPEMRFRILAKRPEGLQIRLDGKDLQMEWRLAELVRVDREREPAAGRRGWCRLTDLRRGEQAWVRGITGFCRGLERRRLLDLGLVPGSPIVLAMEGIFSSPLAYRIRGVQIALRKEQADHVLIEKAS